MWLTSGVIFSANQKLQRVANPLLHLISPTGGVLCVEHVCGGGGGELPQGQGSTAGRGGSIQGTPPSSQNCKEEEKLVYILDEYSRVDLIVISCHLSMLLDFANF